MGRLAEAKAVIWCWALALALVFIVASCGVVHASVIKDEDAIRAIIGEASSEGKDGMRAVASAIRNRGTLKGVYGLHAKHVNREPKWVWAMAKRAWADSKEYDYANQATHWEGTAFKVPYWAKSMKMVKQVGNQKFYKEIRK